MKRFRRKYISLWLQSGVFVVVMIALCFKTNLPSYPDPILQMTPEVEVERFRPLNLTLWTSDLHSGPIGCQLEMFESMGIKILANIKFGNCGYFKTRDGSDLCAKDLKVFENVHWKGFSLDPDPIAVRREFFNAYVNEKEFADVDIVFCSHPAANCELYLPFNKSIVVYNTQRIEMGRGDNFIRWRKPYLGDNQHRRWRHWVLNLRRVSSESQNLVASNNLYDVHHMEFMTGVMPTYIPSWCGDPPEVLRSIKYAPRAQQFVLTPYRTNLQYSGRSIPEDRWPLKRDLGNVLHHEIFQEYHALARNKLDFDIVTMDEAFKGGKFSTMSDFFQFKGAVVIPYQASTIFFFQLYRACVPILAPSPALLFEWTKRHHILWEVSYGNPEALGNLGAQRLPDPNSFRASDRRAWFEFYDIYNEEAFPHVVYFDSWQHAARLAQHTNFSRVSENMRKHNLMEYKRIRSFWHLEFSRIRDFRINNAFNLNESAETIEGALKRSQYPRLDEAV